jgi:hypothetical protein
MSSKSNTGIPSPFGAGLTFFDLLRIKNGIGTQGGCLATGSVVAVYIFIIVGNDRPSLNAD